MPAKKKKSSSSRRYYRKVKRYVRHRPKPSLAVSLGFAATQFSNFGKPSIGPSGPLGQAIIAVQRGAPFQDIIGNFLHDELQTFLGLSTRGESWTMPVGTVVLVSSGLAHKYLGRLINPYIKRVPMIGNKITF